MDRHRCSIPAAITLLRAAAAPLFYQLFLHRSCAVAFAVFLFAAMTDILDGMVARRLSATSAFGAYLDVIVDFLLIVTAFAAFVQKQWYCALIVVPVVISFAIFLISSGVGRPLYDPVGKYLGSFCMGMILVTLLVPDATVRKVLTYTLAGFFTVSLLSRGLHLRRRAVNGR